MKYELNNIYNVDAYQAIKDIHDKSIDLIITDPPYDFTKNYDGDYAGAGAFGCIARTYHSELEKANIHNNFDMLTIFNEFIRIMKRVNLYVWCSKNQIRDILNFWEEKGYFIEIITWHKSNPIPTCNNKYLSDTEYCIFVREKGVKIYGCYETKRKWYVTEINRADKDLYEHPTIKHIEIIKNFIINSSKENDVVFDCFLGSGTTAVACKELNRQYLGFEIDKDYYKIACDRLNGVNQKGEINMFETNFEQLDLFK